LAFAGSQTAGSMKKLIAGDERASGIPLVSSTVPLVVLTVMRAQYCDFA